MATKREPGFYGRNLNGELKGIEDIFDVVLVDSEGIEWHLSALSDARGEGVKGLRVMSPSGSIVVVPESANAIQVARAE